MGHTGFEPMGKILTTVFRFAVMGLIAIPAMPVLAGSAASGGSASSTVSGIHLLVLFALLLLGITTRQISRVR
jgi:hypothetical protein